MSRRAAMLLWMCAALSPASGRAQPLENKDVFATLEVMAVPGEHRHGLIDYRVRAVNKSFARSRQVRLVVGSPGYGSRSIVVERNLVLAPGGTADVSLFLPQVPYAYVHSLQVFEDGRLTDTLSLPRPSGRSHRHGSNSPQALIGRNVNADDLQNVLDTSWAPAKGSRPAPHQRPFVLAKSESETREWNDSWLSYSCFDGVLLDETDWQALSAPALLALRRYMEVGGLVAVLGQAEPPASRWTVPHTNDVPEGVAAWQVGFGRFDRYAPTAAKDLTPAQADFLLKSWTKGAAQWDGLNSMEPRTLNRLFPVIERTGAPIRGLFFLMIGFAVLIGPVNWLILARWNRRIWVFWTVPAISFATCGIVFLSSLLTEGVTPTVRMDSVTLLDEESRSAATLGMAAYYCPLTPRDGLRFDLDTAAHPCLPNRHRDDTGARTVDWTRDQHFASGWIAARVPAHFMMRKSGMRRERLHVAATADGALEAMNGLGAPIRELWLTDWQGRLHKAENIPAGQTARLAAVHKRERPDSASPLRALYTDGRWHEIRDRALLLHPPAALREGTYMAFLDGSPFLDIGLAGRFHDRSASVVIGWLPETATPTRHEPDPDR